MKKDRKNLNYKMDVQPPRPECLLSEEQAATYLSFDRWQFEAVMSSDNPPPHVKSTDPAHLDSKVFCAKDLAEWKLKYRKTMYHKFEFPTTVQVLRSVEEVEAEHNYYTVIRDAYNNVMQGTSTEYWESLGSPREVPDEDVALPAVVIFKIEWMNIPVID